MVCWTLCSQAARAVQAVTSHNFPALGVKTDLQGHTTTCLIYAILILVIFVAQQLYERLGQLNFVRNIPIQRGTKSNCPQVSSLKGKARGIVSWDRQANGIWLLDLYSSLKRYFNAWGGEISYGNIPMHRGIKCNCPQIPKSKGKVGGTRFLLAGHVLGKMLKSVFFFFYQYNDQHLHGSSQYSLIVCKCVHTLWSHTHRGKSSSSMYILVHC